MTTATGAPLVSVITATFNSCATLDLTLRSVLQQDLDDFEVWVIGDGCTDESEACVAALHDSRVRWHNLVRNTGSQSAPNNEGLRRARGRYIAFIGHDDLWLPWHLSALVRRLENGADLVHGLCPRFGPAGLVDIIGPPRDGSTYEWHFIPPSSWLHRRELVEAVGPWRDSSQISLAVDCDFIRRTYLAGQRIDCVPTVSVLKFPSWMWGAYARTSEPPQRAVWEAIQASPHGLVEQVLIDFAMVCARRHNATESTPLRAAWRDLYAGWQHLGRSFRHALLNAYGRDTWPLSAILVARCQRMRRQARPARGLPT
jgi:glycosyltransferase involved in cell wall biosynthesis